MCYGKTKPDWELISVSGFRDVGNGVIFAKFANEMDRTRVFESQLCSSKNMTDHCHVSLNE